MASHIRGVTSAATCPATILKPFQVPSLCKVGVVGEVNLDDLDAIGEHFPAKEVREFLVDLLKTVCSV